MKIKINRSLLPIKAHYFFFMAALGPILPQINVFAKELGIPADVMGFVTSILPFLYILAKPAVGYLIDYFTNLRKCIFSLIILIMTLCYAGLYLVPSVSNHIVPRQSEYNFTENVLMTFNGDDEIYLKNHLCTDYRMVNCHIGCKNVKMSTGLIKGFLTKFTIQNNHSTAINTDDSISRPNDIHLLKNDKNNNTFSQETRTILGFNHQNENIYVYIDASTPNVTIGQNCNLSCFINAAKNPDCVTNTVQFWCFVLLMSLGTIGFNVANCVSDATCFDVLGETETMKYGAQRVWGTIGFGLSALLGGIVMSFHTPTSFVNETNISDVIGPALLVMIVFCGFDLISIKWLTLPTMTSSESIIKDVWHLMRQKSIVIFLLFATLAGVIDSFIIYYMFWHLEEVAMATETIGSIKLIEGCVVAAECLGGEILFFLISGWILKKIGYVHCLSFCFFMYSLRLGLISLITNPWYLVLIELFMQGPTYALCYTCIVAYASAVSPPGTTATVQGLVAGMDDGVGFAIGSLIGGQMFQRLGGAKSFRYFSIGAIIVCVAHIFLRPSFSRDTEPSKNSNYEMPPDQLKLESTMRSQ